MNKINRRNRSAAKLIGYHEAQHRVARTKIEDTPPEISGERKDESQLTQASERVNDVTFSQNFETSFENCRGTVAPQNDEDDMPELFF